MSLLSQLFRRQRQQDLDDEIQAHLAMAAQDRMEQGGTLRDSQLEARKEFGNVLLVKETTRSVWGWQSAEALLQDLRYAFRSLRASPVFALVAIGSLALGIGANTAIFSFVNALLLKRLPVPEPERLVRVAEYVKGEEIKSVFSFPFLSELERRNTVFDGILGRYPVRVNLATGGGAEPLRGELVTAGYFKTLAVRPVLGRLLSADDVGAANPVCVVSYSLWQQRFPGETSILGRKLILNSHPYTVIGVTEKGFYGSELQARYDLQLPISRMGDFMQGFFNSASGVTWKSLGFTWLETLARLKPGVTLVQAQAAIDPLSRSIRVDLAEPGQPAKPASEQWSFQVSDASQGAGYDSTYSKPVTILMGVVGLVLLIACANLANLLLARASARAKECAIRLSLGASRWRLVRQFMVESLVISFLGGLLGLVLASWFARALLFYLNPRQGPGGAMQVELDPLVIGFSLALSLLTALLFGLIPAWQSTRPDIVPELKGLGRGKANAVGAGLRRVFILVEVALSLVILFSAGLLTRTLSHLKTIDLGFSPDHVIVLRVDPAMNGYSQTEADQVFDRILARLRAVPGLAAAGLAVISPLDGGTISLSFEVPGHVQQSTDLQTNFNMISPGYFQTLNQALLAGRDFDDRDVKKSRRVAIVNEKFVAQYMPGLNPIGRLFNTGRLNKNAPSGVEIVGLVKNARYQDLREATRPLVYLPAKQTQSSGYRLLVRTKLDPNGAIADIKSAIRSVSDQLPIYGVLQLQDQINQGISAERTLSFLSAVFSVLATLLSSIGIYGLIAYAVSRRTREIGVRFAVGAQKSDVAKLFLRETAFLIAAGIAIGIPLALASTRVLTSLLFGVTPGDPSTLAFTILIFVVVGALASFLPVRKAARMEPLSALRYE